MTGLAKPIEVIPFPVPILSGYRDYRVAFTPSLSPFALFPPDEEAPANEQPTAAAGSDQRVERNTEVFFDGQASFDPDSPTLIYSWTSAMAPLATDRFQATPTLKTASTR